MKCPKCGKWNQASQPHCIYCGTILSPSENPSWMAELQDKSPEKAYIRVDENGDINSVTDYRDELANEMANLKRRKQAGTFRRQQLSENPVQRRVTGKAQNIRIVDDESKYHTDTSDADQVLAQYGIQTDHQAPNGNAGNTSTRFRTTYNDGNPLDPNASSEDVELFDGYDDLAAHNAPYVSGGKPAAGKPRKRKKLKTFLMIFLILILTGTTGFFAYHYYFAQDTQGEATEAYVTMTLDQDGLTAHTVNIPGTDGQRITIRELRASAIVTGGYATYTISDHLWYDDQENILDETMTVTLTPYLVSDSGKQTALDQIQYDIDIPLSSIELDTPSTTYQVVATTLYNIVFYVQPGSTVSINDQDYSDLVNSSTGKVSYNATVQPIGENQFNICTRSQYCRENTITVTLYREKQEIPLDLSSDISSTSSSGDGTMTIKGTTMPGAVIKVLSPYMDLDITETATNGNFSFIAKFDHIGDNSVIITAEYPGKKTTRVEHVVHYVPNIDIYSRKAWDIVTQYTDLMDNLDLRKSNTQIYVCKGTITSVDTTKPQRCFMNVGTEEDPLMIYLENSTQTTWVVGNKYRIYADVYGMYDSKPWLIARYTYSDND